MTNNNVYLIAPDLPSVELPENYKDYIAIVFWTDNESTRLSLQACVITRYNPVDKTAWVDMIQNDTVVGAEVCYFCLIKNKNFVPAAFSKIALYLNDWLRDSIS